MTITPFRLPIDSSLPEDEFRRRVSLLLNQILDGRNDARGTFTLAASTTTTAVTDVRCSINSVVSPMPTTANAAAEVGAGGMFITPANGSFTVTHASNAQTDRTFKYAIDN